MARDDAATAGSRAAAADPVGGAAEDLTAGEREALTDRDETALRIAVSRRYYHDDQSKVAIAKALGLSRFQVARLIDEARRDGLVRIEIGLPGQRDRELSAALQDRLGLERVVVVGTRGSAQAAVEHVGRAAADELPEALRDGDVLGVTWSTTTAAMAHHLGRLPRVEVVQLGGAIYPPEGVYGSVEVVRQVAAAGRGVSHAVYAPQLVADAGTADGLRRQPEIAGVLGRYDALDAAVLSVGAWSSAASAIYDLCDEDDRRTLTAAGAIGEVAGRAYDADGRLLRTDLDDRLVGVTADQLLACPRKVVTSVGAYRAAATRAAVAAGFVDTLVVDDGLAAALLA